MARRQMCVFRFGQLAAVMLLILGSASPAAAQSRDQIARGKSIFGADQNVIMVLGVHTPGEH